MSESLHRLAAAVELAVFDVDGVLTDGRLVLGPAGEEYKNFHARDGQGLVMLRDSGVQIAIISGRTAPVVTERMSALGIQHVYQGVKDKLRVFRTLLEELNVSPERCAYVGDDLPDLPVLLVAGLSVAVADADEFVASHCTWRTHAAGGCGAVREVCDLLLAARGELQRWRLHYIDTQTGA